MDLALSWCLLVLVPCFTLSCHLVSSNACVVYVLLLPGVCCLVLSLVLCLASCLAFSSTVSKSCVALCCVVSSRPVSSLVVCLLPPVFRLPSSVFCFITLSSLGLLS